MSEYADSNDKVLEVGDRVYVSVATASTDYGTYPEYIVTKGRKFDTGTVEELNEDGTVGVYWDAAGCSCDQGEPRTEKSSELTFLSEETENVITVVNDHSWKEGYDDAKAEVAESLGIADNTKELTALQERLAALEAKNN